MIALIVFKGNLEKKYSYLTDIQDLKRKDWVVVESGTGYSAAHVWGYSTDPIDEKKATAWIVSRITPRNKELDIW